MAERMMSPEEKARLQAKHRLEEAQARDRVKERKQRTRRLIQEGAMLESVLPAASTMKLDERLSRGTVWSLTQLEELSGSSFFFPGRAHLLTTRCAGGGIPPSGRERALSEGAALPAGSGRLRPA